MTEALGNDISAGLNFTAHHHGSHTMPKTLPARDFAPPYHPPPLFSIAPTKSPTAIERKFTPFLPKTEVTALKLSRGWRGNVFALSFSIIGNACTTLSEHANICMRRSLPHAGYPAVARPREGSGNHSLSKRSLILLPSQCLQINGYRKLTDQGTRPSLNPSKRVTSAVPQFYALVRRTLLCRLSI